MLFVNSIFQSALPVLSVKLKTERTLHQRCIELFLADKSSTIQTPLEEYKSIGILAILLRI